MGDAVAVVLAVVLITCWVGFVGSMLLYKETRRAASIALGLAGLTAILSVGVLASIWVAQQVAGS